MSFCRFSVVSGLFLAAWFGDTVQGADPAPVLRVKSQSVSFAQPNREFAAYEVVSYTSVKGPEMFRIRSEEVKDDLLSNYKISRSPDHGETWLATEEWESSRKTPEGMYRRMIFSPPYCDEKTERLLLVGEEGVLPRDVIHDAYVHMHQIYLTSTDHGKTWSKARQIMQHGDGYSPEHPFPDIHVGKNTSVTANVPRGRSDGAVLVPIQISVLDKAGKLFLPPGAYTYLESALLIGTWQQDGTLQWEISQRMNLPPEKSLRGAFEPTMGEFPDKRVLVVMRANDGHKWYTVSKDGGRTFDELRRWTYTDGSSFFSPSSISQLVPHSDGTWYWIGNICETAPHGNAPRYPLVIGRVDPQTMLLDRKSIVTIDTRKGDDPVGLQLSNFTVVEDRRNGDFLLRTTRWDGVTSGTGRTVDASVHLYRIGQN